MDAGSGSGVVGVLSTSSLEPLIGDEARQSIRDLLHTHDRAVGRFFVPDADFYNLLGTDDGLTEAAKRLFRWIGVKPHLLHVKYSDAGTTPKRTDSNTLLVPESYRHFPYLAAASLALGVIRLALAKKTAATVLQPEFVETASVEAGFGIVILNGLHAPRSALKSVYFGLHQHWHMQHEVELVGYRPRDYGFAVSDFAERYRNEVRSWLGYVRPSARLLLPPRLLSLAAPRHALPSAEQLHNRSARRWWMHIVLMALAVAIVAALTMFILAQRPAKLTTDQVNQIDKAQSLLHAYQVCEQTALKLHDTSVNGDFYAAQHLNETKSRCQSLRNQYNYAVSQYTGY